MTCKHCDGTGFLLIPGDVGPRARRRSAKPSTTALCPCLGRAGDVVREHDRGTETLVQETRDLAPHTRALGACIYARLRDLADKCESGEPLDAGDLHVLAIARRFHLDLRSNATRKAPVDGETDPSPVHAAVRHAAASVHAARLAGMFGRRKL